MSIVPGLTRFREMTKQMAETCQIDSQTRGTDLDCAATLMKMTDLDKRLFKDRIRF